MRINDVLFAFPSILLALVFISVLGPGKGNVILALGVAFIPSFARIVRGEFIRCKNMDYVKLARLAGAGSLRIMFVHILPNTIQVLLPAVMIGFNNAVLAEAGMSYLGIGVQPPDASLDGCSPNPRPIFLPRRALPCSRDCSLCSWCSASACWRTDSGKRTHKEERRLGICWM